MVSVSPKTVNLSTNGTQQFTPTVTGTSNTAVTWTATGGTVTSSGFYIAPAIAGTYTVTARSVADTSKSDTATVTVTGSTPFVPIDSGRKTIAAGYHHSMAIKSDGSLWAWGVNEYGQLGLGDYTNRNVPTQVGMDKNWATVSVCKQHQFFGGQQTMAIKSDGSLWAWGGNYYGQLGLGDYTNRIVPTQIGMNKNWATVSVGYTHTIATKSDGSLWAWGENYYGQLGLGDYTYHNVPTQVGMDKNWAFVAAGTRSTIAIKSDGSLWAWGYNRYGQLGLGDYTNRNVPTQVGTDKNWATVSIGEQYAIAIKSDGSLWYWGRTDSGLVGYAASGNFYTRHVPNRIGTGNNWVSVSAGYDHAMAIESFFDSTYVQLNGWGWNRYGQVGSGYGGDHSSFNHLGSGYPDFDTWRRNNRY